jgi:hypothetical protein
MSLVTRNLPEEIRASLVAVVNQHTQALGTQGVLPHYSSPFDSTGASLTLVTTADASTSRTSKTLAAALATALTTHGADTDAHSAADVIACAAWASNPAEPANLTEVQSVLNEVKADFNTHIANATPHRGVGNVAGNAGKSTIGLITTADASDQSTANTLANAIKAALNNHGRMGAQTISLIDS